MAKNIRLIFSVLMICSSLMLLFIHTHAQDHENDLVYVIPVEQAVERGLEAFLSRSLKQAEEADAEHVVLEVNTPGGAVDAAGNIAELLQGRDVPITAYVTGEAMSAGAYLALNADEIVMSPGSEMGAAQVIDASGNAASDKAQSAWVANMIGAAEQQGRDPIYAQAMADPSVDLEEYRAGSGRLLTLTDSEALEVGYAEAVVSDREELMSYLNYEQAEIVEAEVSVAEKLARFVTHPVVIPILLSIGSLGLVLEIFSPGFGIAGIMGLSSLFLYFFGHLFAGFAGMETIILLTLGIVLIAIEFFVPGFGIFGLLGIGALIGSMILASFSTTHILLSILIAIVLSCVAGFFLFSVLGRRGPMQKLVLHDATSTEEGYVSNKTRHELIGETGKVITTLRPAGTILVNGEKLDVVSEGGYIEQGKVVQIITTQGSRIVVRECEQQEEDTDS